MGDNWVIKIFGVTNSEAGGGGGGGMGGLPAALQNLFEK